jgi:hypothetical protein
MLVEEPFRISTSSSVTSAWAQQPDLGEGGGAVVVLMVGVGEELLVSEPSPAASGRRDSESRALADASGRDVVEDLLVGELMSPRGRLMPGCGGGPPRRRAREPACPPQAGVTLSREPWPPPLSRDFGERFATVEPWYVLFVKVRSVPE